MSEIEKMYRTAKVVPSHHYCQECQYDMSAECPIRCPDNVAVYPPFTAEKQIELIKFITSLSVCEIENWSDKGFHFAIKREGIYPTMFLSLSNINLQETLADVINNLWQYLSPEEKQQVKGILE